MSITITNKKVLNRIVNDELATLIYRNNCFMQDLGPGHDRGFVVGLTDKVGSKKICDVVVIPFKRFIDETTKLEPDMVELSGFDTFDEWRKEIRRMYGWKWSLGGVLYLIQKIKKGELNGEGKHE